MWRVRLLLNITLWKWKSHYHEKLTCLQTLINMEFCVMDIRNQFQHFSKLCHRVQSTISAEMLFAMCDVHFYKKVKLSTLFLSAENFFSRNALCIARARSMCDLHLGKSDQPRARMTPIFRLLSWLLEFLPTSPSVPNSKLQNWAKQRLCSRGNLILR